MAPWQPFHGNHHPRLLPRPTAFAVSLPAAAKKQNLPKLHVVQTKSSPELILNRHRAEILGCRARQLATGQTASDDEELSAVPPSSRQVHRTSLRRAPASSARCTGASGGNPRPTSAPAGQKESVGKRAGSASAAARGPPARAQQRRLSVSHCSTSTLSGALEKKLAERKQAQQQLDNHNAALASQLERLLRPQIGGKSVTAELVDTDEERLQTAVRRLDLNADLRVKAMLVLVKIYAERDGGGTKSELLELAATAQQESSNLLQEPWIALDLANDFEDLGLSDAADMIYKALERDVLKGNRTYHPHMLLDLAERHHKHGRKETAQRLWKLACEVRPGDPRTRTRFYQWRFTADPPVPDDDFCVAQPGSAAYVDLKCARPLGGLALRSGCPCTLGVAREPEPCVKDMHRLRSHGSRWSCTDMTSSDTPVHEGEPDATATRDKDAHTQDIQPWRAGSHAMGPSAEVVGSQPLPRYVLRELDKLGVASGLVGLDTRESSSILHQGEKPPAHTALGNAETTAARFREAERTAFQIVRSRRLQIRVVEDEEETSSEDESDSDCSEVLPADPGHNWHRTAVVPLPA